MTRQETSRVMAVIKTAYPKYYDKKSGSELTEALNLWTIMLGEYDYNLVMAAVKAVIATNKFPPTVADINERISMLTLKRSMNESEAWAIVKRAISRSTYHSNEEFEKLPEECKSLVYAPEQLKAWALMRDDEINTVVASNFQRAYREEAKKKYDTAMLPESVRSTAYSVEAHTEALCEAEDTEDE